MWQGLLIVLPALLLAAVGWHSLRQDRALALLDARDAARSVAEEFAEDILPRALGNTILLLGIERSAGDPEAVLRRGATNPVPAYVCRVDARGGLLFPPPIDRALPYESLELEQLSPPARSLWDRANAARMIEGDDRASVRLFDEFIETRPPRRFEAIAQVRVAAALVRLHWPEESEAAFERALRDYPDVRGETGIRLGWLAATHLMRLAPVGKTEAEARKRMRELAEPMLREAFAEPSYFTAGLLVEVRESELNLADVFGSRPQPGNESLRAPIWIEWVERWLLQENSRVFHREFAWLSRGRFQAMWLELQPDRFWLARRIPQAAGTGAWLIAQRREDLEAPFIEAIERSRSARAFEIGVDFGGRTIVPLGKPDAGGIVAQVDSEAVPGLAVRVALTDVREYTNRQASRARQFGTLIGASVLAVLVGFVAAWRSFRKQILLSEMKSNFVSSVSHELRTPIASVILMAEELRDLGADDPEQSREYHEFIVKECRRLTSLIENILDYSRIERGAKEYEFEATDMTTLTEQTVKSLEAYAHEHGIDLETIVTGEAVPVTTDARAIQGSLVNLIDNAIKHAPTDTAVTVGLDYGEAEVRLRVCDRGPGIPEADRERVFERFYRRGSELRRETKGTGLGLAIVKHAVDAHRGRIEVTGGEGEGSCFEITLPLGTKPAKDMDGSD